MKVVVLMDSFKGSLTSLEAGEAVKAGIQRVFNAAEIVVKPLADGGEGTVDALVYGLNGRKINVNVQGPLDNKVIASYGLVNDDKLAVIEMSQASGITLLNKDELNPMRTTTKGVGEIIINAINRGCREFIIGIGGSATNDGGMGMLKVLGVKFLDKYSQEVKDGAQGLIDVDHIDASGLLDEVKESTFKIACDVDNVLLGKDGATYIFGPQKGLKPDQLNEIDQGMKNYAKKTSEVVGKDNSNVEGAGAAGGLGFAFISYLNGKLVSGVDLILDTYNIEAEFKDADIVVVGEGKIDGQTANGKAPIGVSKRAKKFGCKVIAFAGVIGEDADKCLTEGIDAYYSINEKDISLDKAMKTENAKKNLINTVKRVFSKL